MSLTHGPRFIVDGLTWYVDAANPKSYPGTGTTWYDMGSDSADGTLTGGISLVDNAMQFTLNSDHVSFTDVSKLDFGSSNFTLSGWGMIDAAVSGYRGTLMSKWNNGGSPGTNEWLLGFGGTTSARIPRFTIEVGTTSYSAVGTTDAVIGDWYNIVGVRNGNTIYLYLQGELIDSIAVSGTINNISGREVNLGWFEGVSNPGFKGSISMVSAHNRALSAAEIKQNFDAHKGRYGL